jgi:FAD/FMN-containing dehydrogenase
VLVASSTTAYALREQLWDVNVVAQWIHDSDSESHLSWTRTAWQQIDPLTKGTTYMNHLALDDRPERLRSSFAGNYDRLVAVKNKYDPNNLFRLNANVKPSV